MKSLRESEFSGSLVSSCILFIKVLIYPLHGVSWASGASWARPSAHTLHSVKSTTLRVPGECRALALRTSQAHNHLRLVGRVRGVFLFLF